MVKRDRLDECLVVRGLVASREEGKKRIMAGEVLVNDCPITKAGTLVNTNTSIRLRGRLYPYVSRGGSKLEKAIDHFTVQVQNRVILDVGASTGGFTDCLLRRGARLAYTVDVGYGQLDWKLRNDSRVIVFEKKNIRTLRPEDLSFIPDLAVVDVSFISLRIVIPHVMRVVGNQAEILALIKPQFEVGKGKVGKGGVVRSNEEHQRVISEIQQTAETLGLIVGGITESPLLGPKGNKEFFIYLNKGINTEN